MELAGVEEYFDERDGALEDQLNDAGLDDLYGEEKRVDPAVLKALDAIPGGGKLLEERDWKKVYKAIDKTAERQSRLAKNREEEEKHLKRIVRGNSFSYLEKSEDRSVYKAVMPDFVDERTQPVPNKVADLKKKIISQMLSDPFLPNPKTDGDTDRDRGSADLTKKFLRADGLASGTNDALMLRESLAINMSAKSAFQFGWVDKTGGGWRPMQVMAHPKAEDASRPLYGPKIGPDGSPLPGQDGKPLMIEKSSSPILRYVAEVDGPVDPETGEPTKELQFTEDAAAAARQWLPKIRRTTIYPNQVRTVPQTATVADAHQIILLMWEPLGQAKRRFPVLAALDKEKLKKLTQWRPAKWKKTVVPDAFRAKLEDDGSGPNDDTIIYWYHVFCRVGDDYVDGAEIAVCGADGGMGLKRETLRTDVKLDDGTTAPVLMDPPVAQFICLQDSDSGDPFGYGFIRDFEGGNEAYAQIWMSMLEAVDIALHRNVMIPATSPITGAEWRRRDGTPLDLLTSDDEPHYEKPPEIPDYVPQMLERVEMVMNTESSMNETANGLDSQYAVSGVAKQVSIRQARTGLSQYWQNTVNGLTQWWRIKVQLAKAHYTVPQQVKLSGVESAYKQPWWIGSDLFGVTDVALEPGSGTMLNSNEKVLLASQMAQNQFIDHEQASEIARSSMTDDLGLPPNIHEERVNKCIALFAEGPPEGWVDKYRANQQATQQYQAAIQERVAVLAQGGIDPQTAQAQAQQETQPPQIEELWTPFDARPNDDDPTVAALHYQRLNRFTSTAEYGKQPPEWRAESFDKRLIAARQAAGIQTIGEQQQAQAAAAERDHGAQEADRARQHKSAENAKDREADLEKHARTSLVQEATAARRASRPAHPANRSLVTRG